MGSRTPVLHHVARHPARLLRLRRHVRRDILRHSRNGNSTGLAHPRDRRGANGVVHAWVEHRVLELVRHALVRKRIALHPTGRHARHTRRRHARVRVRLGNWLGCRRHPRMLWGAALPLLLLLGRLWLARWNATLWHGRWSRRA